MSKWQLFKRTTTIYGMQLHEEYYLDPVMRDLEAFMQSSQKKFAVKYILNYILTGMNLRELILHDLMLTKLGKYGEINEGWTAEEAKGFIKLTEIRQKYITT